MRMFGWTAGSTADEVPRWTVHPITGFKYPVLPWWQIADFQSNAGDIKAVWEASRFDWLVDFAQLAACGDEVALTKLNAWLSDWCVQNSAYLGPNWKCGQEAALRVLRLALAAHLLGELEHPSDRIVSLLVMHLRRIRSTLSYAIAQDNNHGTSEAAALYIGGYWLSAAGLGEFASMGALGREALEERILHLVDTDGCFSQYSTNYHRLFLDTVSLASALASQLGAPGLSARAADVMCKAIRWMALLTSTRDGRVPNWGHNDGSLLLALSDADSRDFRPTLNVAAAQFADERLFEDAPSAVATRQWLRVNAGSSETIAEAENAVVGKSIAVLRSKRALVTLRLPYFRFRPAQADLLHVDLWLDGRCIFGDAGSFSYADAERGQSYYPTTRAHNTVQFDNRQQLTRVGRFLWLRDVRDLSTMKLVDSDGRTGILAGYEDRLGARHERTVLLGDHDLRVIDRLSGLREHAIVRWRLPIGPYSQTAQGWLSDGVTVSASANVPVVRCGIASAWESLEYLSEREVPCLELEVRANCTVETIVRWER